MSLKATVLALLLTIVTVPAFAQATTATSGTASAQNNLQVNAYSGMGSGVPVDANGNPLPTTSRIETSGHTWTTPNVQGSYFAGANPCLVGVGASGAGGPIGLSFTFGRNDQGCNRRSDAAAWHALGLDRAAQARMCQDQDNADAYFAATGAVCPGVDPKRYAAQLAAVHPVVTPPVHPVIAPAAPVVSALCRGLDPNKADDRAYYIYHHCGPLN